MRGAGGRLRFRGSQGSTEVKRRLEVAEAVEGAKGRETAAGGAGAE